MAKTIDKTGEQTSASVTVRRAELLPPPVGTSDWARFSRTSYCPNKNDAIVEMTLPRGPKCIFASKYMTVLPDKETLRLLVRKQLGGVK